jgi:hypothetical protein
MAGLVAIGSNMVWCSQELADHGLSMRNASPVLLGCLAVFQGDEE